MKDISLTTNAAVFNLERFDMDLRMYLRKHRDYRKLNEILLQVVAGLKELHELGYVHRDLKPENIVLTLDRPVRIALIYFDRSLPSTNLSHSGTRGTPTYQPENIKWHDGSVLWDLYSLACIAVECDMDRDVYFKLKDEEESKAAIKKHLANKASCRYLFELADIMVLNRKGYEEDPTLS